MKAKLDKGGIQSKQLYKADLGPALDEFEKASKALDKTKGTDPKKVDEAVNKKKAAADKAMQITAQYISDTKKLKEWAKDDNHKQLLEDALTVLSMHIYAPIKKGLS
jgi:predicted RNase H-like nuclease